MTTTQITLTIGKETRVVEARVTEFPKYTTVTVDGLKLTTTTGNQVHTGWAHFLKKEDAIYDISDAHDIRYIGMRGNGHAKRSKFRNVSF